MLYTKYKYYKKEINLKHDNEISKIPDEIKISFDYARNSGVLNK